MTTDHEDYFAHDDSCSICRRHREIVRALMENIVQQAVAATGVQVPPRNPFEEWHRFLEAARAIREAS